MMTLLFVGAVYFSLPKHGMTSNDRELQSAVGEMQRMWTDDKEAEFKKRLISMDESFRIHLLRWLEEVDEMKIDFWSESARHNYTCILEGIASGDISSMGDDRLLAFDRNIWNYKIEARHKLEQPLRDLAFSEQERRKYMVEDHEAKDWTWEMQRFNKKLKELEE